MLLLQVDEEGVMREAMERLPPSLGGINGTWGGDRVPVTLQLVRGRPALDSSRRTATPGSTRCHPLSPRPRPSDRRGVRRRRVPPREDQGRAAAPRPHRGAQALARERAAGGGRPARSGAGSAALPRLLPWTPLPPHRQIFAYENGMSKGAIAAKEGHWFVAVRAYTEVLGVLSDMVPAPTRLQASALAQR